MLVVLLIGVCNGLSSQVVQSPGLRLVSYKINEEDSWTSEWDPPMLSAVCLSAAITACARIHMYSYISRSDCYYTDTDSVVLGSPLPEDRISSTELGKFKLEHFVDRAHFITPKCYLLKTKSGNIIKNKGIAKDLVDADWFESQYLNPSQTITKTIDRYFMIDWERLHIYFKKSKVVLTSHIEYKREPIYNNQGRVVDTKAKIARDDPNNVLLYKCRLISRQQEYEKILKEKDNIIVEKDHSILKLKKEIQELSSRVDIVQNNTMDNTIKKIKESYKVLEDTQAVEDTQGVEYTQPTLFPTNPKKTPKKKKRAKKKPPSKAKKKKKGWS